MIYKYFKDTSKHAINDFKNDRICFKHVSKFNDQFEFDALFDESVSLEHTPLEYDGRKILSAQIIEQKFRIRVFCASINGNNEHLWKNYANDSRGFCLGYDEQEIKNKSDKLTMGKVEYSDLIPRLSNEDIEGSVLKQIFHKSLNSDWAKEQEFRIALFLDENSIKVERWNYKSQFQSRFDDSEYITICSELPINHFTRQNNELPIFERKTAPLYFYLNVKPKVLIIGNECPESLRNELESIANQKGIPIKNQGDINV